MEGKSLEIPQQLFHELKSQVARLEEEPEVLRKYGSIINDQLETV